MKPILLVSLILSTLACCAQQVPVSPDNAWKNLKSQLQKRSDVVSRLMPVLSKSKEIDKEWLQKAGRIAVALKRHAQTIQFPDSSSMAILTEQHSNLCQALGRTLITMENDRKLHESAAVRDLMVQLGAIENRVMLARKEYNKACLAAQRKDLLFAPVEMNEAPNVVFEAP